MSNLKLQFDPREFTYYRGLALAVGQDLKKIAYNATMRELAYIEKLLLEKQLELRAEADAAQSKEGEESGKSETGIPAGVTQADGSETPRRAALADAEESGGVS